MAAGATYTPIATTTLSSAQASVTFSSISGSYTDLFIVMALEPGSSLDGIRLRFNSDTGSNYSWTQLYGGASTGSNRGSNQDNIPVGATSANERQMSTFSINNYSNSTTYKTVLVSPRGATTYASAIVGLWRNTNAITSLSISVASNTMAANSTFTIYGIAAA